MRFEKLVVVGPGDVPRRRRVEATRSWPSGSASQAAEEARPVPPPHGGTAAPWQSRRRPVRDARRSGGCPPSPPARSTCAAGVDFGREALAMPLYRACPDRRGRDPDLRRARRPVRSPASRVVLELRRLPGRRGARRTCSSLLVAGAVLAQGLLDPQGKRPQPPEAGRRPRADGPHLPALSVRVRRRPPRRWCWWWRDWECSSGSRWRGEPTTSRWSDACIPTSTTARSGSSSRWAGTASGTIYLSIPSTRPS